VFPLEVSTINIVLLILLTSFCAMNMIKQFILFHFTHLFKTLLTIQHKL
jgi:hypothetical protein